MSRSARDVQPATTGFPRVSGDEPAPHALTQGLDTFSPRERG